MKTGLAIFCFLSLGGISCGPPVESEGSAAPPESVTDPTPLVWSGEVIGEALGSALALGDGSWFAGAPGGANGRVYQGGSAGLRVYLEEEERGALGHSLATHPSLGLLAGAPLRHDGAGAIVGASGEHQQGLENAVLGTRIRVRDNRLLALSALGYWVDDVRWPTSERPSDIELVEGQVVVAYSRGDSALIAEAWNIQRPQALDEAGFSLCVSDFDEDGRSDIALGAPGANRVYLLWGAEGWEMSSSTLLEGPPGRFGHSLACHGNTLVVGAPLHLELRGAAWRFQGSPSSWTTESAWIEGEAEGDQLGFSVVMNEDFVLLGAPGLATGPGKVLCVR